jgi:hypothetical protein
MDQFRKRRVFLRQDKIRVPTALSFETGDTKGDILNTVYSIEEAVKQAG